MTQQRSPIPERLFMEIVNAVVLYLHRIGIDFQVQHAYAADAQHMEVHVREVYPQPRRRVFAVREYQADCWIVQEAA